MSDMPVRARACSICGDTEPFHVHDGDRRIENYFTVGRGMSDMDAAREWHRRAVAAEAERDALRSLIDRALDEDQDGYRLAPDLEVEMRAALAASVSKEETRDA